MTYGRRTILLAALSALAFLVPSGSKADIVVSGSFGPNGDVGFVTSPPTLSISFGAQGQGTIFQMDGFVNATGHDFGSGAGVSADLANGAPSGLIYGFSESQPTAHQLLITYSFTNVSGAALPGFQLLHFVDPDIGPNFADESATNSSTANLKLPNATSFQVGDPSLSTIFTNLTNGTLSNVNEQPTGTQGDVSAALGFNIGTLAAGQSASFEILLSDDGATLGNFSITQTDPVFTGDHLTISGQAVVPEPTALVSMAVGTLVCLGYGLRRRVFGRRRTQD